MIIFLQYIANPAHRPSNTNSWFIFAAVATALLSPPTLADSSQNIRSAYQETSSSFAISSSTPTFLRYDDPSSYPTRQQQFPLIQNLPLSLGPLFNLKPELSRLFNDHQKRLQGVQSRHLSKRQHPAPDTNSTFPQPFDTSLGTEFDSDTCGPFISEFLQNSIFQSCHPFSLLLTTSQAFYQAGRALNTVTTTVIRTDSNSADDMPVYQVLDASCKADSGQCQALFDQLSSDIKSPRIGCGKDLEKHNSLALQALSGLSNYKLMREVACLTTQDTPAKSKSLSAQNPGQNLSQNALAGQQTASGLVKTNSTGQPAERSARYCFEDAMSSQTPDDLYYYYLPLGTSLPSGTQPSCNDCTRAIMKLYAPLSSNKDLTLYDTYPSARTMTNSRCGPGFAAMPLKDANRLASSARPRFASALDVLAPTMLIILTTVYIILV
ncbi:hypothetical protein MJO28_002399 [Puccinia striiformis f. sp. tritici]|uniref:DUF7729 domain-containing protein n=3 Tax=Puccinia striiformis TaxID=27350 RepID=A0A0L0URJ3_9BASI|nr:hypothetical protein Pst134EA_005638 [Puccinia striiformis f. sp. tritici]KNE89379.1 hypothetical protein PSTG_17164 [Puccinia striiformis f. sp. tritici PST-78]POW01588.1 hypothetical protein PSTT_12395 [Puccinia striiformis]KAH9471758.1 hypothetical protein Pst134EA_005638 [Puccinia striiformis f. sp. tritici]KAI7958608.1 hypothetical protein MJO28_002399 [Puccinia striiformis f. sp. tritici]KAI7964378.1 hypothetical protein MJO29_002476 [Puccinia striiformis f. sp. tritici]